MAEIKDTYPDFLERADRVLKVAEETKDRKVEIGFEKYPDCGWRIYIKFG